VSEEVVLVIVVGSRGSSSGSNGGGEPYVFDCRHDDWSYSVKVS